MIKTSPTPFPEINTLLAELLVQVREVLGPHFMGMYLEGSLANGDFDTDSDIDFVVVSDEEISPQLFIELHAMHRRIAVLDSVWAVQLEGSYLSAAALRRYDPACVHHPNLERGAGEQLKWWDHDEGWNIHRHILRERGITLVGPDPKTLIDPLTPDELRQVARAPLGDWAERLLLHPEVMAQRGYQSYVVLTLCRVLYTLQFGEVVSKPKALSWAKAALGEPWAGLIERAWQGRHTPGLPAEPEDGEQTLLFIRYVRAAGKNKQDGQDG
jgi:hypothetical protein